MRKALPAFLAAFLCCAASAAEAQFASVGVDQAKAAATGKTKALLVDVRSPEEYQQGHIPGAVNIPAERIAAEKGRLPKDKAAAVIFYCRGVG